MANKKIYKLNIDGEQLKQKIYDKGYSINSISKEIGVSSRIIRHYLKMNKMPPYIYGKIYVLVEDVESRYREALKELASIESEWLKRIPTREEIITHNELIIYTHDLEMFM